jgi:hypothetical protein
VTFGTPRGKDMEQIETCFICGKPDSVRDLGLWFVNLERRPVHVACWIATYEAATGDDQTAA